MAHPNKHIREAIKYAKQNGWTFVKSSGHAYGRLLCPAGCCIKSVWSTPRNPQSHARRLRRAVDICPGK